jgi:hypothetical protein
MLSYLDSRWLLVLEGAGMHKMGWKWMTFAFFSIRIGAFQMNRLARLAYLILMNSKRYFGDACMKQEWAGKTLHLGLLSYLMKLRVGGFKLLARPLYGLWLIAWLDTKL